MSGSSEQNFTPYEALSPELQERQRLIQEADRVLSYYGRVVPSAHQEGEEIVPWGGMTPELPLRDNNTGELRGTIVLARDSQTLTRLLIATTVDGRRGVVHNFNPTIPFDVDSDSNQHLGLLGDTQRQDPESAKKMLEYIDHTLLPIRKRSRELHTPVEVQPAPPGWPEGRSFITDKEARNIDSSIDAKIRRAQEELREKVLPYDRHMSNTIMGKK